MLAWQACLVFWHVSFYAPSLCTSYRYIAPPPVVAAPDLNTSYVDLFLLHYPDCWGDLCGGDKPKGTFLDSWRALEQLYDKGLARAIGGSPLASAHQPCRMAHFPRSFIQYLDALA